MNNAITRSTFNVRIELALGYSTKQHSFRLAMNHAITGIRIREYQRLKASELEAVLQGGLGSGIAIVSDKVCNHRNSLTKVNGFNLDV